MSGRVSGDELLELYFFRMFETNSNLEDAQVEEAWLQQLGWTVAEFEQLIAEDSLGELDV